MGLLVERTLELSADVDQDGALVAAGSEFDPERAAVCRRIVAVYAVGQLRGTQTG